MYRALLLSVLSVALLAGADWPRFRGPEGAGVSDDTGLPTTWTATENVVWKTDLPGFGSSSPITLGDKIYLTCYSGYGLNREEPGNQNKLLLHTLCLERATGKIVWDQTVEPTLPETDYDGGRVDLHGYASATPVSDGESVYVFFGKSGLLKYTLDGKQLWRASVGTGIDKHKWGSGASPILYKDLLIVNASCESQSIQGLNKATGEKVWQVDGIVDSWSTPLVVQSAKGRDELVVIERSKILGLDPATGKQLWYLEKPSDYVCPSVIANGDVVYVMNSRMKAMLFAIRTGGTGDITDTNVLWKINRWTTRVSTPVYYKGYLYAMDFTGQAMCVNAETGEEVFNERMNISGDGDKIYASLVAGDGKLYCVTRQDGTVVLALEPKFREIARNYLGDETIFNATPTVDNGKLLLRSDKAIYCIGK